MARDMDEFVEQVKESTDILKVISSYVPLKKRGNNYFGCCPFHNEKTPSFSVAPEKGFFYCFGCHAGGDVFKFLSLIENITYFEAIKKEAERLRIEMPQREKTPEEIERDKKKSELYSVNELARKFFHSALINTAYGRKAKEYLVSRGIGEETIAEFQFGFAPDSWDKLTLAFTARDIKKQTLISAGLAFVGKDGKTVYDRFRARVMIPITDIRGRVVAFGGRIIEKGEPKYLNTADTLIFKKGEILFNLDRAYNTIRSEGYAVIVEGYMDAIALYASGVKNAVASLGTAFTGNQAKLLMRYAKKFYFCYDSDDAGQNATIRALIIAANLGAEIFVITVPDGKDPDEFIRKHGKDAFKELIPKAMSLMEFRLQYVLKRTNYSTLDGKLKALREMLPVLAGVRNETVRLEYRKKLAKELMIDEGVIESEMKVTRLTSVFSESANYKRKAENRRESALDKAGRIIIKEAIEDESTIDYIKEILPLALIENEGQREIFQMLFENGCDYNIEALSEGAAAELSRAIVENYDGEKTDVYIDALKTFEKQELKIKLEKMGKELETVMANGKDYTGLLAELKEVKKKLDDLQEGG